MKRQAPGFPLLAALACLLQATTSHAALVAHYTFDSNLDDAVGSQHLSTVAGAAAAGNTGAILGGGALGGNTGANKYLDGLTDQVATSSAFTISGNASRTVSAWFKSPADPGAPDNGPTLVGMGDSAANGRRFDIRLSTSGGALGTTYDGYIRLEAQGAARTSDADLGLDDDQWHHVLVSFTGGASASLNNATVYIDGKVVTLASNTTALNTTAAPLVIGGSNHTTDTLRNFHGLIDDVGIWSSALAATDAALVHGLGRIGNNDLSSLAAAATLWGGLVNDTATINGVTWQKVDGLTGTTGDWSQVNGPNGNGSFVVLNNSGSGLRVIPEPNSLILALLAAGSLQLRRRRR